MWVKLVLQIFAASAQYLHNRQLITLGQLKQTAKMQKHALKNIQIAINNKSNIDDIDPNILLDKDDK